mmetsp:Transcript_2610/g.9462  ORF Transcript_2610/g.9462 Transcript_2610/m.9462 type:complete len:235 (-) Transcript_2610:740-1444(-)
MTSRSARSKSCPQTLSVDSSRGAPRSSTLTWRFSAKDVALLTRPSSSAPLKFFVLLASQSRSTSEAKNWLDSACEVWIFRICRRPFSSGRPISICTSKRPGLIRASSRRSFRLVMPMRRMLLSASTPSILVRSWLTMVSCTPVPSLAEPRCLQMASISSKMMMCRSESSPCADWSSSASLKRLRMFSSLAPTYLLSTSGPFTTLGSRPFSILPICRAMSVLPVPGGPYRSIPLT